MPGIIITPGTSNPPAEPAQIMGVYRFPKTPDVTLRKPWAQFQWASRPSEPDEVPAIQVNYCRYDFVGGNVEVGVDVDVFNNSKPTFATDGVRYVPDATYTLSSSDPFQKRYRANSDGIFEPAGMVELGSIHLEQGAGGLSFTTIRVKIPYSISVEGTADGATYAALIVDGHPDGLTALSGELWLSLALPPYGYDGGEWPITGDQTFDVRLLRNGQIFERIIVAVPVNGSLTIAPLDGTVPPSEQPEISVGVTFIDTLFGADTEEAHGTLPLIPFIGYDRQSFANQGEVTLP